MPKADILLWASLGLGLYAYAGYPLLLAALTLGRRRRAPAAVPLRWPELSITVPVHNEARTIGETLACLLALEYPARRQILVVSDASTDGTDEIVSRLATRGVELLRLPHRVGKTAAENAARVHLRGEIIVNTDASVRVHPQALKPLVAVLADPTVGVASGRDVSVARSDGAANRGESTYVDYEMWVRDLETRLGGIVGASGCLYAIRAELHRELLREDLSRDFAAALIARRRGLRAVSVPEAVCFVPRSASLRQEYRRKVRTMARGLRTLWAMHALLNPVRHGCFAWMLLSHKLCRWFMPWALIVALGSLALLSISAPWARVALGLAAGAGALAACGSLWPTERTMPRLVALPAYAVAANLAGLHAWVRALTGAGTSIWEPTRRPRSPGAAPAEHYR
jgi:glycosyltransferase involved in cell wall biosynthesis